jgi:low temperature requirement protein LtrA
MTTETAAGRRVRPLELFFDLVFVFAITQVTGLVSADPTWAGLGRGLLVLAAIWWAWASYSWLTNTIDPDLPVGRLSVLAAMTAMLIVALAVPEAFGSDALLFACAYFLVRALHIVVYASAAEEVSVRGTMRALAPTSIAAPALLVGAGFLDGAAQAAVWCLALAIDYSGPYLRGVEGLTVSPSHFAERYGLIVIIALGESIVAIGVGAAGLELGAGEIAAATAGLAVAGAMWWTYFDVVAVVAERRLSDAAGPARARLARDSYSYLHLPLIAGVVFVALAIKKTLEHVDRALHRGRALPARARRLPSPRRPHDQRGAARSRRTRAGTPSRHARRAFARRAFLPRGAPSRARRLRGRSLPRGAGLAESDARALTRGTAKEPQ